MAPRASLNNNGLKAKKTNGTKSSFLSRFLKGEKPKENEDSQTQQQQQQKKKKIIFWKESGQPKQMSDELSGTSRTHEEQTMDSNQRYPKEKRKINGSSQDNHIQAESEKSDGGDDLLYANSNEKRLERKRRQEQRKHMQKKARKDRQEATKQKRMEIKEMNEGRDNSKDHLGKKRTKQTASSEVKSDDTKRSSRENNEDLEGGRSKMEADKNDKTSTVTSRNETNAGTINEHSRKPTLLVMGTPAVPGSPSIYGRPQPVRQQQMVQPNQAIMVTALVSLTSLITRMWIVVWITKKLAYEDETISPIQHFVWECLNDRYTRDDAVLTKALSEPINGFSRWNWNKYLKGTRATKPTNPPLPSKTVLVVDITPNNQLDLAYLSDVVTFLIGAYTKKRFLDPEVVLLLKSTGGEVTSYGLAANQIFRLRQAGMVVTVCIDNVAASGGYMMASQATQIVAAPFGKSLLVTQMSYILFCSLLWH